MTSGTREIRLVIRGELVSQSSQGKKKPFPLLLVATKLVRGGGEGGGKDVDGKVMYRGTAHLKSL